MVKIELAGQAGGGITVVHAELAAGAVAIGVDRGLGHAELAGDLLGRQMLIDQAQAFTLSRRKKPGGIIHDIRSCAHSPDT
ncbi:MAG: hypothetical protein JWQ29_1653 [Phenylobacterium sp.]|nr:hypothetical protein [Phenylobacterium sp.]